MPVTIDGVVHYAFPATVAVDRNSKLVPNAVAVVLASATGAQLTVRDLTGAISGLMSNDEGLLPGFLAPQLAPVTIDMGAARLPLASLEVGNLILNVDASKTAAENAAASAAASAESAAAVVPGGTLLVQSTYTAAHTLVLADAGAVVEMNTAAASTLTVPANSSVAFSIGTIVGLRQYGAGQVTVTPATGVTIRSRGAGLKLTGQYAEATLTKRAADEWILAGDVTT